MADQLVSTLPLAIQVLIEHATKAIEADKPGLVHKASSVFFSSEEDVKPRENNKRSKPKYRDPNQEERDETWRLMGLATKGDKTPADGDDAYAAAIAEGSTIFTGHDEAEEKRLIKRAISWSTGTRYIKAGSKFRRQIKKKVDTAASKLL